MLAFLHGLRFDAAALLTINLPFIALSVFPNISSLRNRKYQQFLRILYVLLNTVFFFVNLIDIEYFKFIGRRTSNELLIITQDIADQASHLAVDYWYFIFLTLLLGFILNRIYPVYREPRRPEQANWDLQRVLAIFFLGIFCTLGIRGGTQYKPLRISHAFVQEPAVLGNLALNSTFTFIRSLNNAPLEKANYFANQAAVARHLGFSPQKYATQKLPPQPENVVIIILESFASEYIGYENNGRGYTPFFDSLAAQGTFFRHNYANGKRSILALPSILAGLPSLMDDPFISSVYESNQLFGLGSILNRAGYTTSFFHGAANGTMGFNAFTKSIGITHYYGLNEYPKELKERDYDGLWGIVDEPYLQYVVRQLTKQKPPFAATVFTLSSHDPYFVPAEHRGKFPKGNLPIHETIGYTDYALRQFFKSAARQPWYQNTLFVLTGDHTHKSKVKDYNNLVGMHKVPLLFYHPGKKFPAYNTVKISQHADILPTLVHYLQVPTNKLLPFGHSLLDSATTGQALLYLEGVATLLHQDYITQLNPNEELKLYQYQLHGLKRAPQAPDAKRRQYGDDLKAYLQYFKNGLIENNLYYWIPSKLPAQ
ncbi:sulfatase [Adhaeribacter aerolatus]|uniref:Sulfatase n=1 Tax=Adhaeribacter aerolatus TaxID=670289 RepID=A0A512AYA6_9BACT|nr:sulfatase [Adhaeribacter aerolatus]